MNFLFNKRVKIFILLVLMTGFSFFLSVFRFYLTEKKTFLFLNWNLFLAIIPWIFSSILILKPSFQKSKIFVLFILTIWLLFFPNAPYILTDLFHLKARTNFPMWFDLVLILVFAWTGLFFGFISLFDIEEVLENYFTKLQVLCISLFIIYLSSFGVYLGRFLRWNSWDIIKDPFGLYEDVISRVLYPTEHLKTWSVTFLMGTLLVFIYFSLRLLKSKEDVNGN